METNQQTIREAVGLFNSFNALQKAIDDLETSGFERGDISVLGNETALKKAFGDKPINITQLEDDPKTPRSINIRKAELGVAQGVLIGISMYICVAISFIIIEERSLAGIIIGLIVGMIAGSVMAKLLAEKYTAFFQKEINNGGMLLWVHTDNKTQEKKACTILKGNGAKDVHMHDIELAT